MAEVSWTEPAPDDLRAILEFIGRDSEAYAARLGRRILDAPRRLAGLPRSGSRVPEYNREDIRELTVRPYRIIYCIRGEECLVLTVLHGSRDLARHVGLDDVPEE